MAHQAPSRGVLDGIKNDLKRSKEGEGYKPNGIGNAYSHNFLNQANFRNQAKVYEAQQAKIQEAKQKEIAKAEFQAEQEYLQTLSFLSPAEQEKYKERQGVQFLYMKPPGADSMPPPSTTNQKPQEAAADNPSAGNPSAGKDPSDAQPSQSQRQLPPGRSHVGNMSGAVRALKNHDKWEVKHLAGLGSSPARGAAQDGAENQTFLPSSSGSSEDSEGGEPSAKRRREVSEERLAQAEEVLRKAGIDMKAVRRAERRKHRKEKKQKKKKRKK